MPVFAVFPDFTLSGQDSMVLSFHLDPNDVSRNVVYLITYLNAALLSPRQKGPCFLSLPSGYLLCSEMPPKNTLFQYSLQI
jgi:hypothetical protein